MNNQSVVLEVLATDQGQLELKINQQPVASEDLTARLVDIYKTRGRKVMFVKAGDNVPKQDVASVIDEAHYAGVDKIGLIVTAAVMLT